VEPAGGWPDREVVCRARNFLTVLEWSKIARALIIHRRGNPNVPKSYLMKRKALTETERLLRSPRNAKRLIVALMRTRTRKLKPQSVEELRRDFGLDK
jgi:hypothetical protein